MIRYSQLSSIKKIYSSFYSAYLHRWHIRKIISKSYYKLEKHRLKYQNEKIPIPIMKIPFQQFNNENCLTRWGELSDRQFGGSSKAKMYYHTLLKYLVVRGKIDTTNKDKLQTYPFIGIIQRYPFQFQVGIFNSIRIQLMGDGQPITCQLQIHSPINGIKIATGTIITDSQKQWKTFQLPFRNFQILGHTVRNMDEFGKRDRETVGRIIDDECINQNTMEMHKISFRLQASESVQRQVLIKKIQLVCTIRAEKQNYYRYIKPYFYLVDQNQQKDQLLNVININAFEFRRRQ